MPGPTVAGPNLPLRKPSSTPAVTPARTGGGNSVRNDHHSSLPDVIANFCNYCSKPGNFRCVRCRKAFYCSVHCQTQDWPAHRHMCCDDPSDTNNAQERPGSAAMGETDAPLQPQLSVSDDSTPQRSPCPQRTYLKDLKAHGITKGTEMKGMVAEFSSPSRFFVLPQDPQVSENMKIIVTELQKTTGHELAPPTTSYTPSQGEVCTVQFSMDGNWYRGVVLSVSSEQKTASVLYVDFGNEEDVPLDRDLIKPLPVNLQTLPPCVLECSLSGVVPVAGSWTRECCMAVKQVMSGKCLPVSVMDTSDNGHVFAVDVLLSAFGKHLSTFLLDQGYAAKETKKPSEQDINSLLSASLENYKRLSSGKDENLGAQPPESLTQCVGDTFDALVTILVSPNELICQKLDNTVEIYEQQVMLREHCGQIPADHNFRPAPGTMCCSLSSEDKQWYRAKVLAYSSEDCVCVGYIDFGISEEVELSCLRPISPSLLALPMQAIPCALAGVRPTGEVWSDECMLALSQAVSNRVMRVQIVEKRDDNCTALVVMMDTSSDPQVDVAELLLSLRHAAPLLTGDDPRPDAGGHARAPAVEARPAAASAEVHRSAPPVEAPPTTTTTPGVESPPRRAEAAPEAPPPHLLWYCRELPSDGQAVAVVGSVVANPGDFHCYLYNPEDLQKLLNLSTELQQHCKADSAPVRPRVGEPCCAMFADGAWYRAMVHRVFEDMVEVYFVDYGNSSLVKNINLRAITPELLTLPFQAIHCSLAGVQPVDSEWSSDAICRFQSLMVDLKARVISVSERGYQVELESSGHSVATSLILDKLATLPPAAAPQETCRMSVTVAPETQAIAPPSTQAVAPPSTQAVAPPSTQAVAPPSTQAVAPPPEVTSPPGQSGLPDNSALPAGCFPVDWKAGELPLNEIFQPRVAAIISPSLFYLHAPSQIGMEELQQVMMELAAYGSTNQGLCLGQTPAAGAACCARFTGDDSWYRAVVLETADADVTVLYADYGNTETLPYSSILPIPPRLLQLPVQIARCALTGKESFPSVWPAEELAMFKVLLSDGVTATVDGVEEHGDRDHGVHLLSVTLPPHMGGGHLNTLMLNALHHQPQANTPPPPHPTPPRTDLFLPPEPPRRGDTGASGLLSPATPSATAVEPDRPAGSTVATADSTDTELLTSSSDDGADATGSPTEPDRPAGGAHATGSMPESTEAAVLNGVDRPVCCCVELKTKMAHLEQLMDMQFCLLTKMEKQAKKP